MSVEIAIEMLNSILMQAGRDSVGMKRVGGKKQKHWIDKSMRERVAKRCKACKAYQTSQKLKLRKRVQLAWKAKFIKEKEEVCNIWLERGENEINSKLVEFHSDKSGKKFWKWATQQSKKGSKNSRN